MNRETPGALQADFQGYRGSGCPEISAPGASYAVAFLSDFRKRSASDACSVRLRFGFPVKTTEEKNTDRNYTSTHQTRKEHHLYRDEDPLR